MREDWVNSDIIGFKSSKTIIKNKRPLQIIWNFECNITSVICCSRSPLSILDLKYMLEIDCVLKMSTLKYLCAQSKKRTWEFRIDNHQKINQVYTTHFPAKQRLNVLFAVLFVLSALREFTQPMSLARAYTNNVWIIVKGLKSTESNRHS